ncbi:hypothetical protein G6M04_30125 [Agrobacterium rhizogenes]|uniref:hypothetical protein n=1 Tax=Rhizobium rhizogenes TaxID=359 RepID=UPI00157414C5|nr:hypothetical protein [Rhizobium rhizogenes]NTG51661.1 hypothetical protein [Rhizobium rhizogenes]
MSKLLGPFAVAIAFLLALLQISILVMMDVDYLAASRFSRFRASNSTASVTGRSRIRVKTGHKELWGAGFTA